MYEWAAFLATASGACAMTGQPPPSPEEVGWVVKDQAAAEHAGSNRDSQRIHQRNDPTRPQVDNEPTNHHRLQLIITRVCVCVCVCV